MASLLQRFMTASLLLSSAVSAWSASYTNNCSSSSTAPVANTRNGTYVGYYEPTYGTDYFLGMPFAQPPVGDLRFRVPQSLNTSWTGTRNATQYSPECIGYGLDTESQGNYVSEDCLTLNVVRSRGSGDNLPVVVWIHGGGFVEGGSADHRYNQSFIVQQAALAGMPILAVSINYRLSAWGFLYGSALQKSGNTNLGFRDQRLALQWVQENIAAFGGDPIRVTVQGESAGAISIGVQLLAYEGRDDHLFQRAIAESGTPFYIEVYQTTETWDPIVANISKGVGCQNATDVLSCLRQVPVEQLNDVINSTATAGAQYSAVIDGDFVAEAASVQLQKRKFLHVPLLIGTNTDEGTSFGPQGVNTTQQFLAYAADNTFSGVTDNTTATDFALLYPNIPAIGIPATIQGRPGGRFGSQFKRTSALAGDLIMQAPRRLMAHAWANNNVTLYSYRFNVQVNGVPSWAGVPHFQEVAFVFYNTMGYGYPQNGNPNPLGGVNRDEYLRVALLMTRMWISFISFGDPNKQLGVSAEYWPVYTSDAHKNYVFEQNCTSHPEDDYYRAPGMKYISDLIYARAGRNCSGIVACGS